MIINPTLHEETPSVNKRKTKPFPKRGRSSSPSRGFNGTVSEKQEYLMGVYARSRPGEETRGLVAALKSLTPTPSITEAEELLSLIPKEEFYPTIGHWTRIVEGRSVEDFEVRIGKILEESRLESKRSGSRLAELQKLLPLHVPGRLNPEKMSFATAWVDRWFSEPSTQTHLKDDARTFEKEEVEVWLDSHEELPVRICSYLCARQFLFSQPMYRAQEQFPAKDSEQNASLLLEIAAELLKRMRPFPALEETYALLNEEFGDWEKSLIVISRLMKEGAWERQIKPLSMGLMEASRGKGPVREAEA